MKITDHVEMLEITGTVLGRPTTIFPTLTWDADNVVLIDAGFPGQLEQIRAAFQQAGVPFDRLNRLILTHHDIDHLGGARKIQEALPGQVQVLALDEEKEYINGEKRPLKLAQMEANLAALPPEARALYDKLNSAFRNSQVQVDQELKDGDLLSLCGGIELIATPGHTRGHICLYLPASRTLVAGDALAVEENRLVMSPPSTNFDQELYRQSLQKLARYPIDTIICYHGGRFDDQSSRRIAELVQA